VKKEVVKAPAAKKPKTTKGKKVVEEKEEEEVEEEEEEETEDAKPTAPGEPVRILCSLLHLKCHFFILNR